MRIGIDGRALQGKRAGVGRYVFELCRALDKELVDAAFIVYSQVAIEMPVLSERWVNSVEPAPWAARMKSALWLKTRAGRLCKQDNLDAYWATATFIPSLARTVKIVSTVHDLNYFVVPETMSTPGYWAARLFFARDVRRANQVLANSHGTAKRLYKLLGRQADGVVLPAVGEQFSPPPHQVVASTLRRLGIDTPYLLAVGTLEPRKNLELLIEVFVEIKQTSEFANYSLLLAGGAGWKDSKLRKLVEQTASASIKHLGYVDDADLPSLYAGARAFVFPSIYEGFGIPALEARACGANIIASDIPEIREAGGAGGVYFTPTRVGLLNALHQWQMQTTLTSTPEILPGWSDGARTLATALKKSVVTA